MERQLWPGLHRWAGAASETTNRGVSSDHRTAARYYMSMYRYCRPHNGGYCS